jgi:hypothetical protein
MDRTVEFCSFLPVQVEPQNSPLDKTLIPSSEITEEIEGIVRTDQKIILIPRAPSITFISDFQSLKFVRVLLNNVQLGTLKISTMSFFTQLLFNNF